MKEDRLRRTFQQHCGVSLHLHEVQLSYSSVVLDFRHVIVSNASEILMIARDSHVTLGVTRNAVTHLSTPRIHTNPPGLTYNHGGRRHFKTYRILRASPIIKFGYSTSFHFLPGMLNTSNQ